MASNPQRIGLARDQADPRSGIGSNEPSVRGERADHDVVPVRVAQLCPLLISISVRLRT
jgi:hypothetical protein